MGSPAKTNINVAPLPPDTELGIYRIVQEVLTNIGKYAQPSEISVELGQTAATV